MPRTQTPDVTLGVIEKGPLRFELGIVDGTLAWRCDGAVMRPRAVVAALEDYEPLVSMTRRAVAEYFDDRTIKVGALALALRELLESKVVLNRGLREAVLDSPLRFHEVAIRCGKSHSTSGGGETTWLKRRLGRKPEPGKSLPTPWIHTDVLALIAREGLGVAPMDVERGWNVDEPVG